MNAALNDEKASRHDTFMRWLADFKQQVHQKSDNHMLKALVLQMETALNNGGELDEEVLKTYLPKKTRSWKIRPLVQNAEVGVHG